MPPYAVRHTTMSESRAATAFAQRTIALSKASHQHTARQRHCRGPGGDPVSHTPILSSQMMKAGSSRLGVMSGNISDMGAAYSGGPRTEDVRLQARDRAARTSIPCVGETSPGSTMCISKVWGLGDLRRAVGDVAQAYCVGPIEAKCFRADSCGLWALLQRTRADRAHLSDRWLDGHAAQLSCSAQRASLACTHRTIIRTTPTHSSIAHTHTQ